MLLGNGHGTFHGASKSQAGPAGTSALFVTADDFNKDGKLDLLGNGDGTFQPVSVYIGLGRDTVELGIGDFNGDHHADVVALDYTTFDITLFLGNGHGTLQTGISFPVGGNPISVVVADFNRDQSTDMAVVSQIPNDISVLLNTGP